MRIRTRSIVVAAAVLTVLPLLSGVAAPVPSTARVQLSLPRPTGSDAVGLDTLHLVDASRPDPWVPQSGPRQLMVSMYYPALPLSGRPAAYMSPAEAQALISFAELDDVISAATLAGTRTWARVGASPLPGRYPLVVLSPGFSVPRYELTGLAEDIASKGFVVASIDHAYESTASQFPDGILPCVACDELKAGTVSHEAIALGRARDVSFVIDELVGPGWAWRRAGLIDPVRIGMAGHSIGGDATAATMKSDRRVRAGASLDGPFTPVIPASGLGRRPFLMFGDADAEAPGVDPTWDASWPNLDGWKRWLTVTNGDHYTFTDLNYLVNQSGGLSIPGAERSIKITRAYVAAFFEQSLKTIPRLLLGGPSKAYPEVVFNEPCG